MFKSLSLCAPSAWSSTWVRTLRCCAILLLVFLLAACGSNRDKIAAGLPDPDKAFYTGTVSGNSVFIWDCYQGKRIAIYRYSGEMTAGSYQRQEVACGELTPIETSIPDKERHASDPKQFWG